MSHNPIELHLTLKNPSYDQVFHKFASNTQHSLIKKITVTPEIYGFYEQLLHRHLTTHLNQSKYSMCDFCL